MPSVPRAASVRSRWSPPAPSCWCCAIVGVLWLGARDVIDGRLSAGTLGQFVLYALIGGSVGALAEVWNELQRAAGGMGRIGELLQEDIEIRAPAAACAAATAPG